jgi:hypothetical protein
MACLVFPYVLFHEKTPHPNPQSILNFHKASNDEEANNRIPHKPVVSFPPHIISLPLSKFKSLSTLYIQINRLTPRADCACDYDLDFDSCSERRGHGTPAKSRGRPETRQLMTAGSGEVEGMALRPDRAIGRRRGRWLLDHFGRQPNDESWWQATWDLPAGNHLFWTDFLVYIVPVQSVFLSHLPWIAHVGLLVSTHV